MYKAKNAFNKAKKKGLTNMEICRMLEVSRKSAAMVEENLRREQEQKNIETLEKAWLLMLVIPLNILVSDYWEKTAKKRIPEFVEKCMNLYLAYQNDNVEYEELEKYLYEMTGVKLDVNWHKDRLK